MKYKFKGILVSDNKLVYGETEEEPVYDFHNHTTNCGGFILYSSSVNFFTGFYDCHGFEIYEDDVCAINVDGTLSIGRIGYNKDYNILGLEPFHEFVPYVLEAENKMFYCDIKKIKNLSEILPENIIVIGENLTRKQAIFPKKEINREELKQDLVQSVKEEIKRGNGDEKAVPWLMTYKQALEMLENDFPYDDGTWNFIDLFTYCKKYGMGITTHEEDDKFHKDYGLDALESKEEYEKNGMVSPYYLKFKEQYLKKEVVKIYNTLHPRNYSLNEITEIATYMVNNFEKIEKICGTSMLNNIMKRIHLITSYETGRNKKLNECIDKITVEEFIEIADDRRQSFSFGSREESLLNAWIRWDGADLCKGLKGKTEERFSTLYEHKKEPLL